MDMGDAESVLQAVRVLRQGGLVAVPTETVYGLGADARNELAIRHIFAVKRRPASHPLIVHLGDASWVPSWARVVPPVAHQLAEAFWPGPLTLVLRRHARVLDAITGGQDTVALRVPAHPLMRQLLTSFGDGVAAPSANRFGKLSPTTAEHVRSDLGDDVDFVLDGGPCAIGIESTIVDVTTGSAAILRAGGVSKERLEDALNASIRMGATSGIRAPGLLASHYAPRAGVVLAEPSEVRAKVDDLLRSARKVAFLGSNAVDLPPGAKHFPISLDSSAFARDLYATLREIDSQRFDVVVVTPPPGSGLGLAIRDRLTKAAAGR